MNASATTLQHLLDDAAFLSFEHRLHLGEVLGDHTWDVDLATGRFTVTPAGDDAGPALASGPLHATRAHLLGTAAPGPRSWLWSWANTSGFGAGTTDLATWLRGFGERLAVPELAEGELPFSALPGEPDEPAAAVGVLIDAAKAATRRWASYSGDAGGGTRAAFLLEHPAFELPAPTLPRTTRVLTERLLGAEIGDHRRAVAAYAGWRGLQQRWEAGHAAADVTGPGFALRVSFDEQGRISGVHGESTP